MTGWLQNTSLVLGAGIILVVVLLGILFVVPSDKNKKKKSKRQIQQEQDSQKTDWAEVVLKLEKHIVSLRAEISTLKQGDKDSQKKILIEQEKGVRLQEKLLQERGWKKKEEEDAQRRKSELIHQQEHLKSLERNLEHEHIERLRLEKSMKASQQALEEQSEKRRILEMELQTTKATSDRYRQEINDLKAINAKLSKQHEDTTWIAKSEYVKIEKALKEKEKELAQLKNSAKT